MQVRLLVPVVCLLLAGCGGERTLTQSKTYPAKGRILYNGQPARYVVVRLTPVSKGAVEATGRTDGEGEFELRTYSNEGNDGAVPGEYKVVIEAYNPIKAGGLPKGEKPTALSQDSIEAGDSVEIRDDDNELEIRVP
jgi:hypothetical protein